MITIVLALSRSWEQNKIQ